MTFLGKILVILNMALSLVFLGVTTVAFTTSANWKAETEKQKAQVAGLTKKVSSAEANTAAIQTQLNTAKANFETTAKEKDTEIAGLKADNDRSQKELTEARTALTDAQTNAKLATDESQARTADLALVRDQLSAQVDQGNKLKIQQTELNTTILTLQRALEVAERNAKSLRETSWKFASLLRKHGLPTDLTGVAATEPVPDVEGKVLKVDDKNKGIEVSLGSNDGLVEGQEFFLYRTDPPEYLGKVRITATDPNQAVAIVIGNTVNGKKIKEGDNVASTLRSK
jgi:multidrug efflux pump subunit AcrA (membrane-fusion protein)